MVLRSPSESRGAPIPVEEAIGIARQIAEAVEAGHEVGVIHRDLKPANIKLREDGTVKVLDYGLAKAFEGEANSESVSELSQSPTLTRQGTEIGVILGTAAYMSPEQARGKRVDKRTDIFAFGCVLYEMLTAMRAFPGESVPDVLAGVLTSEPNWSAIPASTPGDVSRLIERCTRKDPRNRLRDIGDAAIELRETAGGNVVGTPQRAHSYLFAALALVLGTLGGALAGWPIWSQSVDRAPVKRLVVALPALDMSATESAPAFTLSRDGSRFAYVGVTDDRPLIYVRMMDELEDIALRGTDGARGPFFSPDGEWIGFFSDGLLKRVSVSGGKPERLCTAPVPRGGT